MAVSPATPRNPCSGGTCGVYAIVPKLWRTERRAGTIRAEKAMKSTKRLLSIAAIANYAVTIWHTYLAGRVNPGLPVTELVRITIISGLLTLVGIALLWTARPKIGSFVLIIVFLIGLGIGTPEHFIIPGPNNLFDVANGRWTTEFKFSVWVLPVVQLAGLSVAALLLGRRSSDARPHERAA